jgi:16S rRNA (guanine966-N2)-methyltransferase
MRITGGSARGFSLHTPKSKQQFIRPTSDRTREALFNIIADQIPGSTVLDLYAGTGALGIEALSRGARLAVFVDKAKQSLELIHANICHCIKNPQAVLHRFDLCRDDALAKLSKKLPPELRFSLVFLDPPYEKKLAQKTLQMVEKTDIVHHEGLVIVEERKNEKMPEQCGTLHLVDQRQYGETGLWLYRPANT